MLLTEQQVTEFQELYKKHLGKEISREEAYDQGVKLLRLMEIVYKPMTKKEFIDIEKRYEMLRNGLAD